MERSPRPYSKAEELRAFLLLAVVMAPVLAGAIVSGYGFLVWMIQLIAGPPGPRM
jgi:nitrate reductase NapE